MKYKLKYPIPVEGKDGKMLELSTLDFGRLKAKHIRLLPESVFDPETAKTVKPLELLPIIAGLADIPVESAGEIDMADLIVIGGEILPDFLSEFGKQPVKSGTT